MNILFRNEYSQALIYQIAHAQRSITLATMTIDTHTPMSDIFTELQQALKRNIKVTLYIDVFTRFSLYESRWPHQARQERSRLKQQLSRLSTHGATVVWLGVLGVNPYKRRFHQKIAVIDGERVFFGGGINLTGQSFYYHDFMLHTKDKKLARILTSQLHRIADEHYISDEKHKLSPSDTLLLDRGRPHSSIIYDTALQYAAAAKQIIYVSQMAPSGKLATLLVKKPTTFYLNSPTSMSLVGGTNEFITQKRYRYTNNYHGTRYIHAKYILFIMPNGEKIALTGSHNFSERGVRYGTKEIALLTKDDALWQQLYSYSANELEV